ncbi:APC family permease [Colwellia sp. MEBiC06753]
MSQQHNKKNNKLKRAIGQFGISALAINGLIGAGIYALPAGAAKLSGNFSPWAFLLCAGLMLLIVLCFAQLSKGFEQTGGPVVYAKQAFGDHISFQTTWLLYVGRLTALAANTNALVLYIGLFVPSVASGWLNGVSLLLILVVLLLINLYATDKSMLFINTITVFKLLPLLLFIMIGLSYFDADKVFTFDSSQIHDLDAALLLLVYAYIGFEGAVVPAGESKEPKKLIAKALLSTIVFTALIYFLIQSVTISVLDNAANHQAPIADAASIMIGSIGGIIITIAAIVSISGNLLSVVFTAPRMTYALAEQGNLPAWFSGINRQTLVPQNSIVFFVVFAAILAISGSFIWLAVISSLARLIGYFIAIASLLKFHSRLQQQNAWVLPLGKLIPLLALMVCIWLATTASSGVWLTTLLFCGVGSVMFYASKQLLIKN